MSSLHSLPVLLLGVVATLASAQAPATVTGTLMIAGKSYKLTHVRAQEQKDPFDAAKKQIRVVLSDVEISTKTMHDDDAYVDLINEEKLHTIEFVFTAAGDPVTGGTRHDMSEHQFTIGSYTFEKQRFDATVVAGKVSVVSPKTSSWAFSATATFSAPVTR